MVWLRAVDFCVFGFGLTTDQFTSLAMHERANLVAYGAMGSEQYLRLVRQRARAEHADTTDIPVNHGADTNLENSNEEQAESETSDDDEMIDEGEQRVPPINTVDGRCKGTAWSCSSTWRLAGCKFNRILHPHDDYCNKWRY